MDSDLLFTDGLLIDGTGEAPEVADVAVKDGKILKIGDLKGITSTRKISIKNRVIAPGFIDAHAHDDRACLDHPDMTAKLSQGITSVVVGNCGISLAPFTTRERVPEPLNLLGDRFAFEFKDFASYKQAVAKARPNLNIAALTGHGALRATVMKDLSKKANSQELQAMIALLREALDHGSCGFSSGLFYPINYPADMEEVVALARVAAEYGRVYATHMRDEYDGVDLSLKESFEAAQRAGTSLVISHHKCAGPKNWGRTTETLAMIDHARRYLKVGLDCYPYTAGSTVLSADLIDGEIEVLITWSKTFPEMGGKYLHHIASDWGCSQQEAAKRLIPGGACYFQMDEGDVQRVLAHPATMIGTDGLPNDPHPHPRLYGAFPRVLGHYARDLGLFNLEQAIHKMTGLTASRFGLKNRGVLKPGAVADLTIFDPAQIRDNATYDNPKQPSTGINMVVVNGRLAFKDGQATGARAGKLITPGC